MGIPNDPRFALVDIPGKGRGLVASREFKRGEMIMVEKPMFLLSPVCVLYIFFVHKPMECSFRDDIRTLF
ncbi:hypothetical protein KIPB_015468 [Kipferlia bialata]|uniref:SET domain-containing protein n=1 Tax=Kipferlia bialata TaxID=797122 RepID=A0A391NW96_9EUKA|nr:hypothetical protein KIPB_015468 [Kipferlia bialata]|eukprot:g15468.t1